MLAPEQTLSQTLSEQTLPALYPPAAKRAPRPLPLSRFLLRFVRNPLTTLPEAVYEQGIVLYKEAPAPLAWVTDPALIETILLHEADKFPKTRLEKQVLGRLLGDGILTSQGPSWRWQRRTAAPLFRPADLSSLVPAMSGAAEAQLVRWSATTPASGAARGSGAVQAVDRDMSETTFRVISETMFAGSADAEAGEILRAADQALSTVSWDIAATMMRVPQWLWYPGKHSRQRAGARLRAAVAAILARRRADGLAGDDLLARLARAQDPETGTPMSEDQLIDNLVTFLAAGHETTAKALTWALYVLSRAPEWQQRVRNEVRAVAGDSTIAAEHLDKLVVTRAVLEETMRLYPPAPVLTRDVPEPVQLGGAALAGGSTVMISIYALHRHKRLWDDPARFDPDRFRPERKAKMLRTQFMPFGFGARTCIGGSFAMMEGVAILATLVRGARFEWDGKHLPEPLARVTLRPKGGMPLIVSPLV